MSSNSAKSFNEIYEFYYKKSFLYVKSYIHDDMAAEDIAAESLIKLWERMRNETIDPIHPYLFTILKNRSLDYLKHKSLTQDVHHKISKVLAREKEIRMTTLEASDPYDIFSMEVQQIVSVTLNSLPEKTREIFIMSRFGNKTHKEIADLFHISVKGVDYHIMSSIRELRSALKDYLPFVGSLFFLN